MRAFLRRHVDPAGRLGEILFGLIMALGFTASVRLGLDEADNRALFLGILGCNLAWAIVDGVMHIVAELFERGRMARFARDVCAAADDEEAIAKITEEVDDRLGIEDPSPERDQFHRWLLQRLKRRGPVQAHIRREDLLGGAAVGLLILLATTPILVPFLVIRSPELAVRVSNLVALLLLFLLGARWGQVVGGRPALVGAALTAVGVVLVLVTIVLGG